MIQVLPTPDDPNKTYMFFFLILISGSDVEFRLDLEPVFPGLRMTSPEFSEDIFLFVVMSVSMKKKKSQENNDIIIGINLCLNHDHVMS